MRGRTHEDYLNEKERAARYLNEYESSLYTYEIIDSYNTENDTALVLLGKTIQLMAEAELVIFMPGWHLSRGCKVEFDIAQGYNIQYVVFGEKL